MKLPGQCSLEVWLMRENTDFFLLLYKKGFIIKETQKWSHFQLFESFWAFSNGFS